MKHHFTGFENFLSRILKTRSPSDSSCAYTKSELADYICDGHYQEGKPKTNVAPPLQLFHPVFGHFLDDLQGTDLISDVMIRKITKYMKAASAIYPSEEERCHELTLVLCEILGVDMQTIVKGDKMLPDGVLERILEAGYLIILHEETAEFGLDGFEATQAGLFMAHSWAQKKVYNFHQSLITFFYLFMHPSVSPQRFEMPRTARHLL